MRRTAIALLAAAGLALAGCSTGVDGSTHPKGTPSVTPSAPASSSAADQIAACTDAIVAGKDSSAPECAGLSTDDVFKALQAANKRGRDALQSAIASASTAAR